MKNEGTQTAAGRTGGAGKTMLMATAAAILVAAGGFAGSLLGKGGESPAAGDAAKPEVPAANTGKPALYASLHPPLVVNFRDSSGASHYMQVTLEVMARDQKVIDAVAQHSAAIRNSLILLFSDSVDYAAVNTREHKEQMLADALTEVQKVVRDRTGAAGVEAVYFTSLIVQ